MLRLRRVTRETLDAFARGAKLLAGRDKTTATVRADLSRRGYAPGEIDAAVERLTALGYLDDARWAASRARRELEAGWGEAGVLARLVAAGLDERLARQAVADAVGELGWSARAAAEALLRQRRLEGARAARFLASRGFEPELVEQLLGEPGP